ncbi:MAG: mechanosensitive ion channel family protein [Anaerolineales bacterium]
MNFLALTPEQWTQVGISALIIVATVVLGRIVVRLALDWVARAATARTQTTLDDVIVDAVRPNIFAIVVVLAFQIALSRLDFLFGGVQSTLDSILFVVYLALSFVVAARVLAAVFKWYGAEVAAHTDTDLDDQLLPFFRRIAIIILAAIFAIVLLERFSVDVSGLVATLGIGSLAIALAAQAALSDTISGFIIMIDRPYRVGDRIELLDLGTWGDVIDIGLRSTRIRTRDNRMVIIPNSVISKSLIVNHNFPDEQYRLQTHVGVAYGTDIELARASITEAVGKVNGVLTNRPVEALFLEFGESALIFRVRWWLESYEDTRRMFDRVNTAIYHALNEAQIVIPFPQRDVHHLFGAANSGRVRVEVQRE